MKIEQIVPVTKKRSRIILEGQLAFVLYKGELSRYQLEEGRDLADDTYREILENVLKKRAKARALHLLMRQDRTEFQLREKLRSDGYPEEVVECAVTYVKEHHYIDDRRYAKTYAQRMQGKKSRRAVAFELARKGISDAVLEELVMEQEEESEEEMIRQLAEKRLGDPHKLDEKEFRRIYAYLMRRGFQNGEVLKVLKAYESDEIR